MKYFFNAWETVIRELSGKNIFLFLDYDGTLTPITQTPAKAVLPEGTRALLKKIASCRKCKIAVISGRALGDIKKVVRLKDLIYVGNHGLEIEGSVISFIDQISSRTRAIMQRLNDDLTKELLNIAGTFVENKGATLSIHYRLAKNSNIFAIKNIVRKVIKPYFAKNKIKVRSGKKVIEIRPSVPWDKGRAVLWLLESERLMCRKTFVPVYVGDDSTDEDAFKELKNKGITIFVGKPKRTAASYYVKDTEEVALLLKKLLTLQSK
ncbi:MAG: trehalose-phosphatase [Candidatus Omnitrophica bacterium]|nr:trehalose-phosphatase [Candidatus Omnitrophota bacterium]